jgi:uncharacterized protein YihD (DUF1040 family)
MTVREVLMASSKQDRLSGSTLLLKVQRCEPPGLRSLLLGMTASGFKCNVNQLTDRSCIYDVKTVETTSDGPCGPF